MERLIFHVDVNSAFLSWESVRRVSNGQPDLRDIPAIVGGNPASRTSVVLAKSIPAKKYGIITGEPVSSALRKCPDLVIAPADFRLYSDLSRKFKAICRSYAPAMEEYSIDECFLDMTGTSRIYPDPIQTAHEIKDRIREELGFTVNIGIGPNKVMAKMAGEFEKPDKVHTLFFHEMKSKMWPLPVGDLLYCGKASSDKLNRVGINTIGDLACSDVSLAMNILGQKLGYMLHSYANGIDGSPVRDEAEAEAPKGYSNETTFEEDLVTYSAGEKVLLYLADSVGERLRKDDVRAYCISVTVRGADMKKHSHQKNLDIPTDLTGEIYEVSKELLHELWDGNSPLRLMGLAATNLGGSEYTQFGLFTDQKQTEKERKAEKAVDAIREKFGRNMIKRAGQMDTDVKVRHRY